jgi:cell division protein FtsL
MLDGSEDLMKEYVTSRVQEKWREFDDLTVRENSLASHERTDLKEEEKLSMEKYQSISNGIRMLNKFIDEHRQTE